MGVCGKVKTCAGHMLVGWACKLCSTVVVQVESPVYSGQVEIPSCILYSCNNTSNFKDLVDSRQTAGEISCAWCVW